MAGIKVQERQLASGKPAKCLRLDTQAFQTLPLFLQNASDTENKISAQLLRARLKCGFENIPPATNRLAVPQEMILPKIGEILCLSERGLLNSHLVEPFAPLHLLQRRAFY